MPSYIPIEDRYNYKKIIERGQLNVFGLSATTVAVGALALGAGAAAAGGIMQGQAAGKAARRQEQAGQAYASQTKRAVDTFEEKTQKATDQFVKQQEEIRSKIAAIDPTIPVPQYNLQGATLEGIEAANKITANTLNELRKIDPDQENAVRLAYQNLQKTQQLASQFLTQGAPEESRRAVRQELARTGGAGFNIATAGRGAVPMAPQVSYGKMLQDEDIRYRLMGAELAQQAGNTAFNWRQASAAFLQPVAPMMALGEAGIGRNISVAQQNLKNKLMQQEMISGLNLGQYQAESQQAQNVYAGRTRQAQVGYGIQQQNIAAGFAADAMLGQTIGQIGGGLMSFAGGMASGGAFSGGGGVGGSKTPYFARSLPQYSQYS